MWSIFSHGDFNLYIFFVNYLLKFLIHFKTGLFVLLLLNFKNSLYILDDTSLSDISFWKYFLPGGLSCSFNIVFHRAEIFRILMKFSCQSWLPRWLSGKEPVCQFRRRRFDPWVRKVSWRRKGQPTPLHLPQKCNG